MPANVETMFSVRETPWHGLGRIVMDAPASREALELAGLDWQVESRNIYSGTGAMIPGYRANVRSTDEAVLGVVSDRYRIVQNEEAFQFTDDLLGEGVTYETAGSLQGGKKVWIMRCLVKNLAMFGLGLYVYAGEDLPEDVAPQQDAEPKKQLKPKSTNQKQEKPPVPCICTRCNQPIKRVKLKDGSIMQAAEFAATHEGMCADCYKATRLNVA